MPRGPLAAAGSLRLAILFQVAAGPDPGPADSPILAWPEGLKTMRVASTRLQDGEI